MRLVHQATGLRQISFGQRFRHLWGSQIFFNDVTSPPVGRLVHSPTICPQELEADIAESTNCRVRFFKGRNRRSTVRAALVVSAARQRPGSAGVHHDNRRVVRNVHRAVRERPAVEEQCVALSRHGGGELIHHTAFDPHPVALDPMPEEGHLDRGPPDPGILTQGEGGCHDQGGGRGQTRSQGDIAVNDEIGARHIETRRSQGPGDAGHKRDPVGSTRGHEIVYRDLVGFAENDGVSSQGPVFSRGEGNADPTIDGHRQNPTVVVVGVLADQIDPSRGNRHSRRLGSTEFPEKHRRELVEPGRAGIHDASVSMTWSGRGFRQSPRVKSGKRRVSPPRAIDLPLSSTTALNIAAS